MIKNRSFLTTLMAAAISLAGSGAAQAAVRVLPRFDYGKGFFHWIVDAAGARDQLVNPISPNLWVMGGDLDMLMQKDPSSGKIEVFACPTVKSCLKDGVRKTGKLQNEACLWEPKYWNCQELWAGPEKLMCKEYRAAYRGRAVLIWAINNGIGGPIEAQIPFLVTGIGGAINDALGVDDAAETAWSSYWGSCASNGLDVATHNAAHGDLVLAVERHKEDVTNALDLFTIRYLELESKYRKQYNNYEYMLPDDVELMLGDVSRPVQMNPSAMDREAGYIPFTPLQPPQRIHGDQFFHTEAASHR